MLRFGKMRLDNSSGGAISSAPRSDWREAEVDPDNGSPRRTYTSSSNSGGNHRVPSPTQRKHLFQWTTGRKQAERALLVTERSQHLYGFYDDLKTTATHHQQPHESSPTTTTTTTIDALSMEIDVETSPPSTTASSTCDEYPTTTMAMGDPKELEGELELEDLVKMRPNDDDQDEAEVEETEALTLSFASGMGLSSCEYNDDEEDDPNAGSTNSPRHCNRSFGKLRFPLLPNPKIILSPTSSITEQRQTSPSLSTSRRSWSRKRLMAEVTSPRRFQRVDGQGANEFFEGSWRGQFPEDVLLLMHNNDNDNTNSNSNSNSNNILSMGYPGLETQDSAFVQQSSLKHEAEIDFVVCEGDTEVDKSLYYPPLPLQESIGNHESDFEHGNNNDSNTSIDMVANGLADLLKAQSRQREPRLTDDEPPESLSPKSELPSVAQSPTKVRAALNRLGKLKKKVTRKRHNKHGIPEHDPDEKQEESMDDYSPSKDKTTKSNNSWAEKISKIATNSAKSVQMVATSVQPLSPLKARIGCRLERLGSMDDSEAFSFPSVDFSEKGKGDEDPSASSDCIENCRQGAASSNNPVLQECKSDDLVAVSNHKDCNTSNDKDDSDSDGESVHFESDAPAGTVWIRSMAGTVPYLEIKFDDYDFKSAF